jgi:serine/threonine protein kinase
MGSYPGHFYASHVRVPRISPPETTLILSNNTNTCYERIRTIRRPRDHTAGIHLVKELRSDRTYVEKYLRWDSSHSELEGEAHFLSIIGNHCPNILQLKEFIKDPTTAHIMVEYMDGGDLNTAWDLRADRRGTFTEHEVWNVLRDISNALRYLETGKVKTFSPTNHQWRPILHADIKPANIAFSKGVGWKLIDFGAAVLMESKVHVESHGYGGTIYWIPPEWPQINGLKADIWSLGVIVHELCTFDYPRDLKGYGSKARSVSYETMARAPIEIHDIARPHTINSHNIPGIVPFRAKRGYTKGLRDIMVLMLDSDPTRRPSASLLHMWTTQFFEAVDKIASTTRTTEFDDAIKVLCDKFYKQKDLQKELNACLDDEYRERDGNRSKRQARMLHACHGFQ